MVYWQSVCEVACVTVWEYVFMHEHLYHYTIVINNSMNLKIIRLENMQIAIQHICITKHWYNQEYGCLNSLIVDSVKKRYDIQEQVP